MWARWTSGTSRWWPTHCPCTQRTTRSRSRTRNGASPFGSAPSEVRRDRRARRSVSQLTAPARNLDRRHVSVCRPRRVVARTGCAVEHGGDDRGVELGRLGAWRELGGVAADEAGVVVAGDERRVAQATPVERQVRLDAAHLILVERAPHPRDRGLAI